MKREGENPKTISNIQSRQRVREEEKVERKEGDGGSHITPTGEGIVGTSNGYSSEN